MGPEDLLPGCVTCVPGELVLVGRKPVSCHVDLRHGTA